MAKSRDIRVRGEGAEALEKLRGHLEGERGVRVSYPQVAGEAFTRWQRDLGLELDGPEPSEQVDEPEPAEDTEAPKRKSGQSPF